MADPLIRSTHLVGSWDGVAKGWSARDTLAGPAGSAGIELPGGIELDVDVAAPAVLTQLWVPAHGPDGSAHPAEEAAGLLVALLGDQRAHDLLTMASGDGRARRLAGDGDSSDRDRRLGSLPRRGGDGAVPALGSLALAEAVLADPSLSPAAHLLASLDVAHHLVDLDGLIELGGRLRTATAQTAERWLDPDALELIAEEPIDASAVIVALQGLQPFLPPAEADGIQTVLAELLRQDLPDHHLEAASARMLSDLFVPDAPPRVASVGVPLDVIERATLPAAFARSPVVARATTGSEIEVRVVDQARHAEGWWARAHTPAGIIVAAAPLRAVGRDAVARLLVPPAELRSVRIDLTQDPGRPVRSQAMQAVTRAVRAGQDAARSERLGERHQARAQWIHAAALWEVTGDQARAGQANDYARRSPTRSMDQRIPAPLLVDPLLHADQ